jgi:hypothetical protein
VDHRQPLAPRELLAQGERVGERAQVQHTRRRLESAQPSGSRASGDDERIPAKLAPVIEKRHAPLGVDLLDPSAQHELDLLLLEEFGLPEHDLLRGALAGEQLLGESRALVGEILLLPDEDHAALETLRP